MTPEHWTTSILGPFGRRFQKTETLHRDPGFIQLLASEKEGGGRVRLQLLSKPFLEKEADLKAQWRALKACGDSLWFRPQEWMVKEHWGILLSWCPPGKYFNELAGTKPDEDYLRWMGEALKDLSVLHRNGLLHLAQNEKTWILFRPQEDAEETLGISDPGLLTEIPIGHSMTPENLLTVAPEILRGGPVDARADLYALACLFLRQKAAHRFVHFQSPAKILELHLRGRMHDLVPSSQSFLNQILRKMLSPDPEQRPKSVGEVLQWVDPQSKISGLDAELPPWAKKRIQDRVYTLILNTLRTMLEAGELRLAEEILQKSEGFLQTDHEHYLRYFQSRLAKLRGDSEGAKEWRRQASVKCYAHPDPKLKTHLFLDEATVAQEEGDREQALRHLREAWNTAREHPDFPMQVEVLYRLGIYFQEEGEEVFALERFHKAFERISSDGEYPGRAKVYGELAGLLSSNGRPRRAVDLIREGGLSLEEGDAKFKGYHALQIAVVFLERGDWEESQAYFTEAQDTFSREKLLEAYLWARAHEARLYLAMGDEERARRQLKEIKNRLRVRHLHQNLLDLLELKIWFASDNLLWSSDEPLLRRLQGDAQRALEEGAFHDVGWPTWKTYQFYERALHKLGKFADAQRMATRAKEVRDRLEGRLRDLGYPEEAPIEKRPPPPKVIQPSWAEGGAVKVESLLKEEAPKAPETEPSVSQELIKKVQELEYHIQEVRHLKSKILEKAEPQGIPPAQKSKTPTVPKKPRPPKEPPGTVPSPLAKKPEEIEKPVPEEVSIPNEKEKIEEVLRKCLGNRSQAAKELKINRRTLFEKIKKYDLEELSFLPNREEIEAALKECDGNKSHAAKKLGLSRSSFYRLMKELGIQG